MDLAPLGAEIDVAVAADAGVAGPFVARQRQEAAVLVEFGGQLVDVGPEGGPKGGKILYQGSLKGLLKSKRSITADYLRSKIE